MKVQNMANPALSIRSYPFQIQVNPPLFFFSPNTTELFSMKFIHSCFDTKTFWKPSSEKATLFTVLERIPCGHSRPTVTVTSTPGCLTGTWVMHKCGGAETKSSQGALKGVRIN